MTLPRAVVAAQDTDPQSRIQSRPQPVPGIAESGWDARLRLRFERRGARTVLAANAHAGPLCVQKALYPEDPEVCHAIVLHPPGGIVGGDRLAVDIEAGESAHTLLTMPGAAKLYRSDGRIAAQDVRIRVASGATVEWLPPETIVFSGAIGCFTHSVELAPGGVYLGWEVVCWGRPAAGSAFDSGAVRLATRVDCGGEMLWRERAVVSGDGRVLHSAAGLGGAPVSGTLLAVGAAIDRELVGGCRAVRPPQGGMNGVTRVGNLVVARFAGHSAECARAYFVELWGMLRPALLGRAAVAPRIWNT